ncbi:hypothetical protein [Gilliamella sp. Bif1-4]|jgi:hypothetical protein|uniref:hypothetical protein n=1 Tax=Gilliamella sp. Bif1-4 TaxID=3120233 RepID=UPI00080E9E27|nr:hypothetical protein [Gilliamella apicola]OCG40287.1 hypothetical protein A9G25_08030 [Gilliamella apicola]
MKLKRFIFLVCIVFAIIYPSFADDSYASNKFDTQTIETESLLANYYLGNGDYHQTYAEHTKLMKRDLSFTKRFHIQNALAG